MGKLTLHAKVEIGAVLALLLGSCNSAPSYSADDAYDLADAAHANAANAINRVSELEERVESLERANPVNDAVADLSRTNAEVLQTTLTRLSAVEDRLGM